MTSTSSFYARPSYLSGAGVIYSGARRQRGGSIFGALKSIVTPLVSSFGKSLKRNVVNNAIGFAGDVVGDIASGRNVKQSFLNRGKERGLRTLKETFVRKEKRKTPKRLNTRTRRQRGSGRKRVIRRRKSVKKSSRKRHLTSKHLTSAKRRRCNF